MRHLALRCGREGGAEAGTAILPGTGCAAAEASVSGQLQPLRGTILNRTVVSCTRVWGIPGEGFTYIELEEYRTRCFIFDDG